MMVTTGAQFAIPQRIKMYTTMFSRYYMIRLFCYRTLGLLGLLIILLLILYSPLLAGSYYDSIHGSNALGVFRPVIGNPPLEYARGNCAHCHEQHVSTRWTRTRSS